MATTTTIFSWGRQAEFQCGRKGETSLQTWPKKMPSDKQWRTVACKFNRSNAISADGEIYSLGTGHMGELGLAYLEKTDEPMKVSKVPPHTSWAQVACGKEHTLALTDGGILYAWGANELGQLGLGHSKPVDRPTRITVPDVKWIMVDAGANHSAGINEFGEIFTWGSDYAGQLGQKEQELARAGVPQKVDIPATFKYISCGEYCTAAISNKGELYTWGSGGHGRLGHGNTETITKPTLVKSVETVAFAQVSVGFNHMLALTDTGWVYAFGAGLHGELGYGGRRRQLKPIEVPLPEKMKQVTAGYEVSFAIGMSGALHVWGNCEHGTAGVGRRVGVIDKPFKVQTDVKFKQIAVSQNHVVALGAGEGTAPPGWSLESEMVDPDAAVVPEGEEKPIASVEALQRLARTLEGNIFVLERKYGYKKTPEEIQADKDEAEAQLKKAQEERAALVAKRDKAREAVRQSVNIGVPTKSTTTVV